MVKHPQGYNGRELLLLLCLNWELLPEMHETRIYQSSQPTMAINEGYPTGATA